MSIYILLLCGKVCAYIFVYAADDNNADNDDAADDDGDDDGDDDDGSGDDADGDADGDDDDGACCLVSRGKVLNHMNT